MIYSRKKLFLLLSAFSLCGCATSGGASLSTETNKDGTSLDAFIKKARSGFKFNGEKKQNCFDLKDNFLFTNTFSYDYSFENSEKAIRTSQNYTYKYKGEDQTLSVDVVRSPDGYVAYDFVNYKNEIDYFKVPDSDGYYSFYDQFFMNPFLIVDSSDFIRVSTTEEGTTYSLKEQKIDSFDYFLSGNSEPLTELNLFISKEGIGEIYSKSTTFVGRTKDDAGNYIRCSWSFESSFTLSSLGEVTLEGVVTSAKKENKELEEIFSSVNDNFTLTCSLLSPSTGEEIGGKKVSYFDGESYYVKADITDTSLTNDFLYHVDPFNNKDKRLFEYRYDKDSKLWHKADTSSETSYNISPQTKDIFVPHLKEMSVDIFSTAKDEEGYFNVRSADALSFSALGFFSDGELLSYFALGYVTGAKLKKEGENVIALIDFYVPYDSTSVLSATYKAVYSDIGKTSIPEVDL